MTDVVYLLCAVTSLACMVLLIRSYARAHARLLLWSGLCFMGLALNNVLLVVDRVLFPRTDLYVLRLWTAVLALGLLVFGLVWDVER